MNRIPYIIMASLCAMSVAQLFSLRHEVSAQTSPTAQATADAIQAYGFPPTSDPNGGWTPRQNVAAYQWHPASATPARPDGDIDPETRKPAPKWPIIVEPVEGYPDIMWYWGGFWRQANGARINVSVNRWAYVRGKPEIWNPLTKRMEIPGLYGSPPESTPADDDKPGVYMSDIQGQWMVDDLKRSFTWKRIQDFGDLSPYDEPDKGAPLE